MNALKNSLEIWRRASAGIGFRNRLLAFLCARLGNLSDKRQNLRTMIFKLIGCFSRGEQIAISFRISNQPFSVFLRKGNKADYLVLGEVIRGDCKVPDNFSFRPTVAIDGGANIGLFTLTAHAMFPGIKVTCYEPDQDNLVQLRRNLEANNIAAEVIPKALWSKTAELFFHPRESWSGYVNAEHSSHPISCVLPVVPDHSWLKLDIEGAEYEVLPALLNAGCRPRIISMEIHDFNRRGNQLLSMLKTHGYEWKESFPPSAQAVNVCAFKRNMKLVPSALPCFSNQSVLRLCFVNCRRDGVDETKLLRNLMAQSNNASYVEVAHPEEADLILITGILERNNFEDLRSNRVWQQHPEKCFGFSGVDNVPSFLHGVYASASRFKGIFNRMQSCGYPGIRAWRPNPCPLTMPFYHLPKKYLFSFLGRRSHPVRKKLFRISWPGKDVLVADITNEYNHFVDEGHNRREMQARYWEIVAQSKFVLCPRGAGASSIRLFEAMEAGVAPVVISDTWKPPIGPDWKAFALFIPERKIHRIYEILKSHESEWMERGKLAEAAYKNWFADEKAWGQLMASIQAIRASQSIPEKWFVRVRHLIYGAELIHEWSYKLPIKVKWTLGWARKRS